MRIPEQPIVYGDFVIPEDNRILYFRRDRASFGFLSHFHSAPILLDDETWPTAEHYFQAQKSFDSEYRDAIRAAVAPVVAKQLAASPWAPRKFSKRSWFRKHGIDPRPDWNDVKLGIMRKVDTAKFTQHPELTALLLATGNAELIEDSPQDSFWGIGPDGKGENWAGRVLMEIRDTLRKR